VQSGETDVLVSVSRQTRSSSEVPHLLFENPTTSAMVPATPFKGGDGPLEIEGRIGSNYELLEFMSELPRHQHLRHIYPGFRSAAMVAGPNPSPVIQKGGNTILEAPQDQFGLFSSGGGGWAILKTLGKAVVQLLPWKEKGGARGLGSDPVQHQVPALLLQPRHTELVKVRVTFGGKRVHIHFVARPPLEFYAQVQKTEFSCCKMLLLALSCTRNEYELCDDQFATNDG